MDSDERKPAERLSDIASIEIEHGRTAAALRESRAHLAEAQRLSSTGSFTWRLGTGEIIWSEQTYRIYDIDPALPVTFDLVFTRIHRDEASWFQELLGTAAREGRDLEFEHRLQMPDGSIKYLHVVAHAARDRDGQTEYVGAVQDVTERRRADDALSKLRSELAHMARVTTLGALTASIAHEVNQPLSGIVTNASTSLLMLAADPPDIEGAVKSAERTIRDAKRAAQVITQLRTLFKKTETASESFDLNEATREVLALSCRELEKARISLQTQFAEDLPAVIGDRVQLQQVVLNLVLNAAEAMSAVEDRPRQLVVRTEREAGDRIRLAVRDTGPGVSAESANRIFETFYTTKPEGMGIGLSISRSIVERHQGRLWLEHHDGPGATFSFSIPRIAVLERARKIDDPSPASSPETAPGARTEKRRSERRPSPTPLVFVVDDDVSVRESLASLIRWAGWKPETFSSGEDFLARALDETPSCLVLDVELPDLDGLELQQRIARHGARMPIIFITGYGDIPMSVRAMKAGAAEFLTKPFERDVMLEAIRGALDRSRTALARTSELAAIRDRYARLTRREREVFASVVSGLLNKQVGAELGMTEATVKAHRSQVMRKMRAGSFAELVRLAARLDIPVS